MQATVEEGALCNDTETSPKVITDNFIILLKVGKCEMWNLLHISIYRYRYSNLNVATQWRRSSSYPSALQLSLNFKNWNMQFNRTMDYNNE